MTRRYWLPLALSLAALWLLAWGARSWLASMQPTAESVQRFIRDTDLSRLAETERRDRLDSLARQFNRLSYEERRKVRGQRRGDGLFAQMTPEERSRFAEQTLPTGMKQMVNALNNMTREERRKLVDRALEDMKTGTPGDGRDEPRLPEEETRKIVDLGLKTYLSESSADTKMDLAPLIDAMQSRLQERGR